MPAIDLPTPDQLRERLEALRRSRGFLLPHHGAMAAAMPDLHDAYFTMYRALTQTPRHLTSYEREYVWLAILIAVEEGIGTHHLDLFFKAGGTSTQAETVARLVGYGSAARSLSFMAEHWGRHLPNYDAAAAYRAGIDALTMSHGVDPGLVHIALAATQAALRRAAGLRLHIEAAYALGVPEPRLAEALSLIIWPVGVNHFLDACAVWQDLMVSGAVTPSASFRVWAETLRQGGFDDSADAR